MSIALLFFFIVGSVYIFNEFYNWQGFAENLKYLINAIPLAIIIILLSIKQIRVYDKLNRKEKLLVILSIFIAGLLLIPPYLIYKLKY